MLVSCVVKVAEVIALPGSPMQFAGTNQVEPCGSWVVKFGPPACKEGRVDTRVVANSGATRVSRLCRQLLPDDDMCHLQVISQGSELPRVGPHVTAATILVSREESSGRKPLGWQVLGHTAQAGLYRGDSRRLLMATGLAEGQDVPHPRGKD